MFEAYCKPLPYLFALIPSYHSHPVLCLLSPHSSLPSLHSTFTTTILSPSVLHPNLPPTPPSPTYTSNRPLHVLIMNAAVFGLPYGTTVDGVERHFGVNHLGHFRLFQLLEDTIRQCTTRIVVVSSDSHWSVDSLTLTCVIVFIQLCTLVSLCDGLLPCNTLWDEIACSVLYSMYCVGIPVWTMSALTFQPLPTHPVTLTAPSWPMVHPNCAMSSLLWKSIVDLAATESHAMPSIQGTCYPQASARTPVCGTGYCMQWHGHLLSPW